MGMVKKTDHTIPGYNFVKKEHDISEYVLKANGLTIIHKEIHNTGVLTTNITYRVGARDELQGESGLAHMLEHMLFKPTVYDLKNKIDSAAMQFERETGCTLNANTSTDRTTYFFNYPVQYFERALHIESQRMQHVVLTDTEFIPERNNVLSEFDMVNGDPYFALNMQMTCTAFLSHSYGHETIGFREDIQAYTPEKLQKFYVHYYRPSNATLTIVGDITVNKALLAVKKYFNTLKNPDTPVPRHHITEPVQEGLRRVEVVRQSNINILAIGIKHAGFPTHNWFKAAILMAILADGPDSILHRKLVDSGVATSIDSSLAPTSETDLGTLFITLAPDKKHAEVEKQVLEIIHKLTTKDIQKLLKSTIQSELTDELFARGNSLRIAMDLTEYISAHSWETYNKTEKILKAIKPKDLIALKKSLFTDTQMIIGYFIGKK